MNLAELFEGNNLEKEADKVSRLCELMNHADIFREKLFRNSWDLADQKVFDSIFKRLDDVSDGRDFK